MSLSVSARRTGRKFVPVAVSAPARFVVIASRIAGPDRLDVVLRGDYDGTFSGAKRHATTLAFAVAERFGFPACADVTDAATGIPLFSVSTAGGAA